MSVCLGLPIRGAAVGPWALWFEVPPPSGPAGLGGPGASPQPSVPSSLVNGVMTVWFGCQSDSPKLVPSQCSDPDMPRLNVAYRSSGSCGKVILRRCCFLSCPRAPGDVRTAPQSCRECPSLWSAGLSPFSCCGEGGTCRPRSGPADPMAACGPAARICVIPEFQGWVEVGSRGREPGWPWRRERCEVSRIRSPLLMAGWAQSQARESSCPDFGSGVGSFHIRPFESLLALGPRGT